MTSQPITTSATRKRRSKALAPSKIAAKTTPASSAPPSESKQKPELIELFRELRLPMFRDHFASLADRAARENLLVFGKPGSGKSHLLCALAEQLILQGRSMLLTTCSLLVQQLLIAKRDLRLAAMIKQLSSYEGLLIDDLGYVQQSREEMEVLFTLLAQRYERGSVLLSSNLPFSKWEQIFKDPMTTAAAIDRLVHHSIIIELNVPSYRVETAKRGQGSPPSPSAVTPETA